MEQQQQRSEQRGPVQTNGAYQLPSSSKLEGPTPRRLSSQIQFHPSTNTSSAISMRKHELHATLGRKPTPGNERKKETPILSDMYIRGGHTRTQGAIHTYPVCDQNRYKLQPPPRAYFCILHTGKHRPADASTSERKRVSIKRLPRKRFSTSARVGVHEWTERRRKAERERERWTRRNEGWLKHRDEERRGRPVHEQAR